MKSWAFTRGRHYGVVCTAIPASRSDKRKGAEERREEKEHAQRD